MSAEVLDPESGDTLVDAADEVEDEEQEENIEEVLEGDSEEDAVADPRVQAYTLQQIQLSNQKQ